VLPETPDAERSGFSVYNLTMTVHTATLEDLQAEAARFAQTLTPHPTRAVIVALSGDLGAGKTSFVQGLAQELGCVEHVTSPTFILERVYPLQGPFTRLAHYDAYRLETPEALRPLGFFERMQEQGTLVVLEWPEVVARVLPTPDHTVVLAVDGAGRTIIYV
jgi:tRNA threonylcarbamoyladenosine biosynthesis protein TsaE